MAQTTASRKQTKEPTKSKRASAASPRHPKAASNGRRAGLKQTTELSEDVLRSLENGQRAAIDAVHSFVDRVDRVLPALPHEDGPSRRQEVIDSALEMTDRLVHAQYDFVREVVHSTGKSLSRSGAAKRPGAAKQSRGAGGATRSGGKKK